MKIYSHFIFIMLLSKIKWFYFLIIVAMVSSRCSGQQPDAQIHTIGPYTLKGPIFNSLCDPNEQSINTLECLSMTYNEAETIANEHAGWDIPDIKDWGNIIGFVLDKDTSEVRKQSFFTGGSPAFTQAIDYENQFKVYNIWVKGKFSSKKGLKFRRILKIQNGGSNKNNLIIMGMPIEVNGEPRNHKGILYLLKKRSSD